MAVENDLVLIYFEDAPLVYARIENITADHKAGWYQVTLLVLQVPLQVVVWILRDAYIEGAPFTMDGKAVRLEKVVCPELPPLPDELQEAPAQAPVKKRSPSAPSSNGKVIALSRLRKQQEP